ncbi:hypothetical protein [uncultured Clostridium sp.]|jgi:hypothetical protein|uniref:hypothetical protein n=2 Tax=Clostridium TaxID=1485 RepID=UPI00280B4C87|nr:hypothetical protein [uncultured Clostridium sp.]
MIGGKMEHLKDLLNFKENKKYKIIILILFLIVVFLQSRTSLINKQVSILRERMKVLTEEKNKTTSLENNSGIYNNENSKIKVIKDYTKEKETLINKYKNIGLEKGKVLNENLTSDNKTLVDETMNLDIIEVNIRSHIDKIKGDSFNIEIEENKISDSAFFRIYLVEE